MDGDFLVVHKYERFWRGSKPSIYAVILMIQFWFYAYGLNLRLHSMSSYSRSMNLRMHSMSSYSPCQ